MLSCVRESVCYHLYYKGKVVPMKYGGEEVNIHAFLTSAPDRGTKGLFGSLSRRGKDNIKKDVIKIGCNCLNCLRIR